MVGSLYWVCIFRFLSFHIYTCVVVCLVFSCLSFSGFRLPVTPGPCLLYSTPYKARRNEMMGRVLCILMLMLMLMLNWKKATCLLVICCPRVLVLSCFCPSSCCVCWFNSREELVVIAFYLSVSVSVVCLQIPNVAYVSSCLVRGLFKSKLELVVSSRWGTLCYVSM